MKWFQLRIIHRIIGTNIVLKSMGIAASENCGLCGNVRESIQHVFWQCDVSQAFWVQFVNWVKEKCQHAQNIRLSEVLVLLGYDVNIKISILSYGLRCKHKD